MGPSDKARDYLEQSVPQLQELLRKEVFTEAEIKAIARKRSDFEHTINARGQSPTDYASYAAYEINLGSLIKKRTARLKVKLGVSGHEGPRRIFFILERGVRKFPGDLGLWMQLLGFARKEKARKKTRELMTKVLRLHPAKAQMWVYAANAVLEDEADMSAARSYLQRGLRFCKRDWNLWIEYARLECIYIGKIAARRKILGLEGRKEGGEAIADDGEDMLALPAVTAEDINPTLDRNDEVDQIALQNLENTPALTGAIPMAIFDAAMKEFDNDAKLGEQFFDMVAEFERGVAFDRILRHIVDGLQTSRPDDVHTVTCQFMLPITGIATTSADFPEALTASLGAIRAESRRLPLQKKEISQNAVVRLLPLATAADLDDDIATALQASFKGFIRAIGNASDILPLVEQLQTTKQDTAARRLVEMAQVMLPRDMKLLAVRDALDTQGQLSLASG